MKNIIINLSSLLVLMLIVSCSSKTEKFLDWKNNSENLTLNGLIDIVGPPVDTIIHDEVNKSNIREYTDVYSPSFKSLEEIDEYYKDWNDKYDLLFEKYEKYGPVNSYNPKWDEFEREYEKLWSEKKFFTYEESDYDRISRMLRLIPDYKNKGEKENDRRSPIDNIMISQVGGITYKFSWEKSDESTNLLDVFINSSGDMEVGSLMERINFKDYEECLTSYDWVFSNPYSSFKFNKDGTGSFSSTMFGGFEQKGNWEFNSRERIYFNVSWSSNGQGLGLKVLTFNKCESIMVGDTKYSKQ